MNHKKGFTLVELVITIGLMVTMGVLIANNITTLFSKREEENVEDFQQRLEDAACIYIDLSDPQIKSKKATCKNTGCYVTTSVLIENGLLDENEVNPLTNQKISGTEQVYITYPNGEKTCTYNVE